MARLPYLDESALDPRSRRVLEQLPVRINLFSMLGHVPSLMGPILRLGGAILGDMDLPPAWRELAILRVAARTGTPYEWHHHEPMARRSGLDRAAIDAAGLVDGDSVPAGVPVDGTARLVLRLVDETLVGGTASAGLIGELETALGPTQVVELVCTVGYYSMVGQILRSLDIDVDPAPATVDSDNR